MVDQARPQSGDIATLSKEDRGSKTGEAPGKPCAPSSLLVSQSGTGKRTCSTVELRRVSHWNRPSMASSWQPQPKSAGPRGTQSHAHQQEGGYRCTRPLGVVKAMSSEVEPAVVSSIDELITSETTAGEVVTPPLASRQAALDEVSPETYQNSRVNQGSVFEAAASF